MLLPYGLATAVIVATAATTVVEGTVVTATAAAEEDEDEDYNPRAIVTTKVTHLRKPPFLFSSHTMQKTERVLQNIKNNYQSKLSYLVVNFIRFIVGVGTLKYI